MILCLGDFYESHIIVYNDWPSYRNNHCKTLAYTAKTMSLIC